MKKKATAFVVPLLFAMQSLTAQVLTGVNQELPGATYDISTAFTGYKMKPGTPEWKTLKTYKEMVAVSQVPEDILKRLTTPALLETCLSYQMMLDVILFNNMKKGFENTYSKFNGYSELLGRKDFADVLVNSYREMDMAKVATLTDPLDKGRFIVRASVMEFLFTTPAFTGSAKPSGMKELLGVLMDKFTTKASLEDSYGYSGKLASMYAMANIVALSDNKAFKGEELLAFKNNFVLPDAKVLNEILSIAKTHAQ